MDPRVGPKPFIFRARNPVAFELCRLRRRALAWYPCQQEASGGFGASRGGLRVSLRRSSDDVILDHYSPRAVTVGGHFLDYEGDVPEPRPRRRASALRLAENLRWPVTRSS